MKTAVTDSGIGGLFVVEKLLKRTRAGKILYLADNAHSPYGDLPEPVLRRIVKRNCEKLVAMGAEAIVLACNTATAVCIDGLRAEFPDTVFVGTEPAVKPAARESGILTVMATPLTLKQPRFRALLEKTGAKLNLPDCEALAYLIEKHYPDLREAEEETERLLAAYPREKLGAVVLGCTHYACLSKFIESRFSCKVFDGAGGVSATVMRRCAPLDGDRSVVIEATDPSNLPRYLELASAICKVPVYPADDRPYMRR